MGDGDESGSTSGVTAKELAAVLQAMDEKYRLLFDAICKQGENSRPEIEAKEDVYPLQMPLVKLEGAKNYSSWAEHAETILVSRKLEGYVLGTTQKPAEEDSKEGQRWKTSNALVRAWLLSSMSPQIAKQVERIKEASEIWRLLKGTYSGVGNEMLACKTQKELRDLSQGEKTVVDYVSELKRLWSDLEFYDPIDLECGKCIEKYHKWIERRHVRDFLNALNQKFEPRRAALYGSGKLPGLEQAISAIISEETRLKLEEGAASVSHGRSALFAGEITRSQEHVMNVEGRTCFECGQPGHLKASCPELFGSGNRGRGRGQDGYVRGRGRGFYGRGSNRGRLVSQGNLQ
uniref:Uncharacterized protein n=1 Tax=Avena sativa TaxID=4498 RepID=A0ACD6ARQ2_AVESA